MSDPEPRPVRLTRAVLEEIRAEATRAYPHEACGALIGPAPGEVRETLALPNQDEDSPRTRFAVSPRDYMAVESAADARGVRLLGFWHSHPDHPARPSATDRRYAWEGLLTIVIAVERGTPRDITAWDVPGPDQPFRQLTLVAGAPEPASAPQEVSCPPS
ncbi:MAG: M67 family metallopeptidase [Acidobacteria bacterium]|jgi:proteasome lid subunit RPN8/RPN11|nr:M67 family metallopeptidase [Acidobacteriota bacterium]